MGPNFTGHTFTPAKKLTWFYHPLHGPLQTTSPDNKWGADATSIDKCCPMLGCLPYHPYYYHNNPTSHTPIHPKLPYTPSSVVPSFVTAHLYLCSLTFSLRPDEAASVWRQQKLVFNKLIDWLCFSIQEIKNNTFRIMS